MTVAQSFPSPTAPLTVPPRLLELVHGATTADLTPRELDMMTLITQGYSNQEIAESLYLGMNSVKTYIRGAYRKIGATRRSHAIIWGFQQGLLDEEVEPHRPTAPPVA